MWWWYPNVFSVLKIKYDLSCVPRYGSFIEILINALRASFSLFRALILLALIQFILLPSRSGHAFSAGIIYAVLAKVVTIGYSSMLLLPKIYLKIPLVPLILGFNLFREKLFFNWTHFFNDISPNLNLSHSLVRLFLFHREHQNNIRK